MATDMMAGTAGKRLVEEICGVAWTRLPGSDGEKRAQAFIQDKMKALGADSVEVQNYTAHPLFFRWWPVISIVLFYVNLVTYHVFPLMSLVAAAFAIANVFFKLFSFEFLDVLFKRKPSSNAIAKVAPRDGRLPKRIVIIGGHADSNYEYPIGSRFGTKLIPLLIPVFVAMVGGALVSTIKSVTALVDGGFVLGFGAEAWRAFTAPTWLDALYFVVVAMVPYASWIGFGMISSKPVPGANDNLSGVAVALLLLERFARPEQRPKNVELWFVSFGSEEGGIKGSKHASRLVREALDAGKLGAPSAWVVNFDSIATAGPMLVATKEPLYRCTYVPEVYSQIEASAKKAGVDVVVKSLAAGTDSAPFGRAGIPATGLVGMGIGHAPANWHSLADTPANVEAVGIERCVQLGAQFIRDVDEALDKVACIARQPVPREEYGALFDAHVHTIYDLHDGRIAPGELVSLTRRHGFNWVLAMNHDTTRGHARVKKLAREAGLPCITGIEISTIYNHVLAYGVQEWSLRDYSWEPGVVIDKLREQGCAVYLAHPCNNPCNGHWTPDIARRLDVDGIEWNNASNSLLNRKTAALFATFPRGRRIAGTDAHTRYTFGHAYTQVATASTDPDDLVSAMKKGRCAPRGRYVPLVCVGIEQLAITVKNKLIKRVNADGTCVNVTYQVPSSIAPEGFPQANTRTERELKALVKPAAKAWRRALLASPPRLNYW